jgi:iron-sulfur cluster repair protein YtfE (RIC family)
MKTTTDPHTACRQGVTTGFEALDECHRQTLLMLTKLQTLTVRLESHGMDPENRAMAKQIVHHFSVENRSHHEDEERFVFPKLATCGDSEIVEAVLRLQQDHDWLEEDWMQLSPQIDAIACGQPWYDLDVLRDGVSTFTALSMDHIALEESCIYPEARARLQLSERREMDRKIGERRRVERTNVRQRI